MQRLLTFLVTILVVAGCSVESFDEGADRIGFRSGPEVVAQFRSGPEVVAQFDPLLGETPESVAIDFANNKYISMALTGEIRKVSSTGDQSTLAVIPLGPPELCVGPFPGIMGALAIDPAGNLYVGASACDPQNKGIWKVTPQGQATMIAALPVDSSPNGIAYLGGYLYVADSAAPRVFRASRNGDGSPAEVWLTSPLLQDPDPSDLAPGANGLQFFLNEMVVANAGAGTLVAIPLVFTLSGVKPGEAYVKYGPPESDPAIVTDFPGCDDFAFDVLGRIYCTTDPFQTLVRIDHNGAVTPILSAEDGLDGPTSAAFGRRGELRDLYITNAAFPFFPSTGNGPSLMKLEVLLPGYPLR